MPTFLILSVLFCVALLPFSNTWVQDTAPDIYETDDTSPATRITVGAMFFISVECLQFWLQSGDSSDDEVATRGAKSRVDPSGKEELDFSNLIGPEEASKKFKKAEQKRCSLVLP